MSSGVGINALQLRDEIIVPALMDMGAQYSSGHAVELLLGTAAQESRMGHYVKQLHGGPALGIYQMEPATHEDIWDNYFLAHGDRVLNAVARVCELQDAPKPERMVWDLRYATVMARVHYYRRPEPLPLDPVQYADYWKAHYNTELGAGTPAEFLENYHRFC